MDKQTILKQIIEEQLKGKSIELGSVDPEALANTIMEEAKAMATPLIQESLKVLKIQNANEDEILEKATEIFVNAINKSIDEEIEKLKADNEVLKNLDLWIYMAKKFAKPTEKVVEIVNVPTSKTITDIPKEAFQANIPKGVFQAVAKDGYDPNNDEEDEEENVIVKNTEEQKPKFKPRKWGRGYEEFGDFKLTVPQNLDTLDWEPMAKRCVAKIEKTLYKGMVKKEVTEQFGEFDQELIERGMIVCGSKYFQWMYKECQRLVRIIENWPEDRPETAEDKIQEVEVIETKEETKTNSTPQEALKKLEAILGDKAPKDIDYSQFGMDDHSDDIVIKVGDNPSETPVINIPTKKTTEKPEATKFNFLDLIK